MSDEKIVKMVNKKQENKANYNFSKLKSQYNLQKGLINKLESQILNSDQVQELQRRQDFEISQKDEIISQCKSELIQLHNTMFQYKEYSQEKSEILLQQQEELILFQALREQYLQVQTNQQYTQTIPIDKPNTTIVQRYTEDQKTEGLLRLIRDGPQLYKKQQNMNNYLPNIQGLMYFKQQLEIKICSQNKKYVTQNSKNAHIQVDNINIQTNNINKQISIIRKQSNKIIKQIETIQKRMKIIKTSQYILNENVDSQNLINNLMCNQQSRIIQQQIDNVQYQMNILEQLKENICKQQLYHNQISIYTSKK
ncbi:Hypothetical_protein [Hexamita inflata]|uniref:Hypothetical_protein n=1 Tax=Hexamita inflata TaxID=28002 RepID=A0AA86UB11_9EUKA|nr:Hypothetical protein HINF_LOCUS33196 [Hexamita inflata]